MKTNFVTSTPSLCFLNKHFKKLSNVRIGSFENFAELKVTLMRKDFTFVNVTGAQNLAVLKKFLTFYTHLSKTRVLSSMKIDSICATHKFERTSNVSFEEFRRNLSDNHLTVKDNSKFPGLTIRDSLFSRGGCCVYFRSGAVNFIGYKHTSQMLKMLFAIEKCLYK